MERAPSNKDRIRRELFKQKHERHAPGAPGHVSWQSILNDFDWYLDFLKKGKVNDSPTNANLWEVMSSRYKDFTPEEFEELVDQLRAD